MAEEGKPKKLQKKYEYYEVSGEGVTRKKKSCPKCGAGVFLAEHPDRRSCGACGYMEKKSSSKPEAKSEANEQKPSGAGQKPKEETPAEAPPAGKPAEAETEKPAEEPPKEEAKE